MNTTPAPGYRDDHLHLLACAATRRSLDVNAAASMEELLAAVRHAVSHRNAAALAARRQGGAVPTGDTFNSWLRVWGYDDALLNERRHPTVAELDSVTDGWPAVLHHITGHVAVVNTAAGRALGLASGEVLTERHDVLAAVPRPDRAATVAAVADVLADLVDAGFTACTDATHTNDLAALELLAEGAAGVPFVDVTAMAGADRLDSLEGLTFGMTVPGLSAATDEVGVRVGHAKVMPSHDDDSAIAEQVATARAHRFPVAIHAMDIDTLQAALDALQAHPPILDTAQSAESDRIEPDRIEHCALALPEQLDRIARLGVAVVTQPSFVTRRAEKYRDQLSATEQSWLWPLASLLRRGITVTFSSDAPTVPPDPAEWIAAATTRTLAPAERIDWQTALRLCQRG